MTGLEFALALLLFDKVVPPKQVLSEMVAGEDVAEVVPF